MAGFCSHSVEEYLTGIVGVEIPKEMPVSLVLNSTKTVNMNFNMT